MGAVGPYHCTVRLSPCGPEVGLRIDDPDERAWRGDFVGDQPFAWCDADPLGDLGGEPGEVAVVILTGARHDQCAHATLLGGLAGTAWLQGVEHFGVRR